MLSLARRKAVDFKEDHFVSTHTFVAYTNINELDLDSLFDEINVDEDLVHVLYKKREKGEKKGKTQSQKLFKLYFLNVSEWL